MQPNSPLSQFLPYRLSITSNAVSSRIGQEYRTRFGLSVPEWRVMAVLGDAGSITQRELTRLTLMDKVAVNRACKMLEERGLATRKPNALDGRSHLLTLTEDGQAMHCEIMPLAQEMERRIFAGLTVEEQSQFSALLGRVLEQISDLDEEFQSGGFGIA